MSTTTTVTAESTSITIDTDGIQIRVDPELVLDALKISPDWIPTDEADEHCDCDPSAAYDEGQADGRRSAAVMPESEAGKVLEAWHNEQHAGVYRFCYEQPCLDLRKASE